MAFKKALYDPKHCDTAIKLLSQGKSLAAVANALGIVRATLYNWKELHPEFKDAIEYGTSKSQELFEDIGMEGIQGNIKNFQGSSWMFTMKNRFRADYSDDKKDDGKDSLIEKLLEKL